MYVCANPLHFNQMCRAHCSIIIPIKQLTFAVPRNFMNTRGVTLGMSTQLRHVLVLKVTQQAA